jgi:hypothetical protein
MTDPITLILTFRTAYRAAYDRFPYATITFEHGWYVFRGGGERRYRDVALIAWTGALKRFADGPKARSA